MSLENQSMRLRHVFPSAGILTTDWRVSMQLVLQEKLEGQEAVFWPERRYPWGVSEAFNPHHSDLLHLRLLLLKEACDELSSAKRTRYGRSAWGGFCVRLSGICPVLHRACVVCMHRLCHIEELNARTTA